MPKTIKQIADELGVSKQAVQKRLSREPLHSSVYAYIDKVGGVVYIAYTGEMLIKQAFLNNDYIHNSDKTDNQTSNLYTPLSIPKEPLYDILKSELEAKNKQIENLTSELAKEREHSREQSEKIAVLADQSQQLQLAQLQQQKSIPVMVQKLSLWKRIFKKNK